MTFSFSKRNQNRKTPEQIRRIFRRVFLSQDGIEVLRMMLYDWSFFDICKTEQQRALNEYAKIFLHDRLGLAGINVYTELDREAALDNANQEGYNLG